MKNIWLEIELSDYENHMALPDVAQAGYLADRLCESVESIKPGSLAIIGCSGGNGLEKIDRYKIEKVICVDINPDFINAAEKRFKDNFENIDFVCEDITSQNLSLANVDLIFAGLLFEYVDLQPAIKNVSKSLTPKGRLYVILQQPNEKIPEVTPSRYKSLERLREIFRFVSVNEFIELCNSYELKLISRNETQLRSGKKFYELMFQKGSEGI